jgi:tetratricopeptide (TPR) repeat protein
MYRKTKNFIILYFLVTASLLLFVANPLCAEVKTFEREYIYRACEDDNKNTGRVIALREVKRSLLDELGNYLVNQAEVKNLQLTKDQVMAFAAGIVMAEIATEKWDNNAYSIRAKIMVTPDEVIRALAFVHLDKEKTKELEGRRKKSEELLKENEKLRKELPTLKGLQKKEVAIAYRANIKALSAADWFETGYSYQISRKYNDAVDAYNNALKLNPNDAESYCNRGYAHYKLGDHRQAIGDFEKAIRLNPRYARAYYGRGNAYYKLENFDKAIKDYDRTIELYPGYERVHNNRGNAYFYLNEYRQAIEDYSGAIEINYKDAVAYCNRGIAYNRLGNVQQAIQDWRIAMQLGNKKAEGLLHSKGIDD